MIKYYNDGVPDPIFRVMIQDNYNSGPIEPFISSTGFKDGSKKFWAKKQMKTSTTVYALPISMKYYTFIGNAIHSALQVGLQNDPNYSLEKRIYVDLIINGKTYIVSGQYDCIDILNMKLWDWKTSSVAKFQTGLFEDYTLQANIYLYILKYGYEIVDGKKVYLSIKDLSPSLGFIMRDWSDMKVHGTYPTTGMKEHRLETWDLHKTETMMKERIFELLKYKDKPIDEIPECTMEQRWQKPSTFPIFRSNKDGSHKADPRAMPHTKDFTTTEEALNYIVTHKDNKLLYIGERKSTPIHCIYYCELGRSGKCNWFNQWSKDNDIKR